MLPYMKAQSPILSYHSHTQPGYRDHYDSGYSRARQPLADFLPTYLAQAVDLWE